MQEEIHGPSTPKAVRKTKNITLNEAIVLTLADVWNNRNFSGMDTFFSKEIANHNPLINTIGLDHFKQKFLNPLYEGFPDLRWISHEVVSDGSFTVVSRWTITGTHKKEFFGYEPTNRKISFEGCSFIHLDNEEIIYELRSFFDTKALFHSMS